MVLEERFGQPETLLKLAGALNRMSDDLWTMMGALDEQVTNLVPSGWDGLVASAFQKHWGVRRKGIHDGAEKARRAQDSIDKLGRRLQLAKQNYIAARTGMAGGLVILDDGPAGFLVLPQNHPGAAALQARVSYIWADANVAWGEARLELGVDMTSWIPDWMKNPAMGLATVPDSLVQMVLHPVDTVVGMGKGLMALGQAVDDLSPTTALLDPKRYNQRLDQLANLAKRTWDRPGGAIEGITGVAVPLGGQIAVARKIKSLEALSAAQKLAQADAAAARAAAKARLDAAGRAVAEVRERMSHLTIERGAAGEAANIEQNAQRALPTTDLNRLPSIGEGKNMGSIDQANRVGFEDVKIRTGASAVKTLKGLFKNIFNSDYGPNKDAVGHLLDPRNAGEIQRLKDAGTWPRGYPENPNAANVDAFRKGNTTFKVADDQVQALRDAVRRDIAGSPETYGLPPNPTEAQVQGLLNRIQGAGITQPDVLQMVPYPGTPRAIPYLPQVAPGSGVLPAPAPSGGVTIIPVIPNVQDSGAGQTTVPEVGPESPPAIPAVPW